MSHLLLIRVALTALLLHGCVHGALAEGAPSRYVVGVAGMVCPTSCANNVREALKTMPEVEDVAIDFVAQTATITTRTPVTREQVHKVLKGSGFGVTTFEPKPAS
jgi:copper chaperone CopZ